MWSLRPKILMLVISVLMNLQIVHARTLDFGRLPPSVDATSWPAVEHLLNTSGVLPTAITALFLDKRGLRNIPSWIFEKLPNVKILNLNDNHLTTLPPELSNLTKLENLQIANNKITEIPSHISTLSNLKILVAVHNQINKIHPNIVQLTKLKTLNLIDNALTRLPDNVDHLIALEQLFLTQNAFVLLPKNIVKLKAHLRILDLRDNPLGEKDEGDALGRKTLKHLFGDKVRL